MSKAYDTILSDYVDAESAAKSGGFEPYRYECACCWEEVHLCAADSNNQATHFRHRSGNNNVICDNYLGNRNAIINNGISRRNIRDKIEFYFSSSTKIFSIGIKFSADEISTYEQSGASFQVRNSYTAKPSISIPIRSSRFYPSTSELIPISEFSWDYYVSSSSDSKQHKYELFRKDGRGYLYPSLFKIHTEGDDSNFKAKLVIGDTLYTNTPYLIVFTYSDHNLSFQHDVQVGKVIRFRTMDRDFSGIVVVFTRKTAKVEQQLEAWKYKLEANETLTLVWPPSILVNESMQVYTDYAYLYSTFELQAHGNINVNSDDIVRLEDGISKVSIKGRTKIYMNNNTELVLEKCNETSYEYDTISVVHEISKNYVASDDGVYFFNRSGISPMSKGMSVFLTPNSEVRHYSFGYLDGIVNVANDSAALTGDRLLEDILMYYKRQEVFNWADYESLVLSNTAIQYIESCEQTGLINSAAKYYIEEGWI
jgi:hypothetical protein